MGQLFKGVPRGGSSSEATLRLLTEAPRRLGIAGLQRFHVSEFNDF